MVKSIAIPILFLPDYCPTGGPADIATRALSAALNEMGVEHRLREAKTWDGTLGSIAVVNGWTKKLLDRVGAPTRNDVIKAHRAAGRDVLCIERGYLGDRREWHGISWNGFCSNGGNFRTDGVSPDRWIRLKDRIGVEFQHRGTCPTRQSPILLCGQVPWDAQVDNGNHIQWLEETIGQIAMNTDRPIQFRPHPKAYRRHDPYGELSRDFRRRCGNPALGVDPHTSFEMDLATCAALVCFNSNVATLGIMAGVPVFTASDSNADPIAFRLDKGDASALDNPPCPCMERRASRETQRERWAWELAYKQWHTDEMGAAWLHLTR